MKEIYSNLFIGNDNSCMMCTNKSEYSIIHACKTCHQKALNYTKSLSSEHPNYLIYEHGEHLFLNMVDMATEFQAKYTHPMVEAAVKFIDDRISHRKVLIHCNQGLSRSPSLGLIYLVRKNIIPKDSYDTAVDAFVKSYSSYMPKTGISLYLRHNWCWLSNVKF